MGQIHVDDMIVDILCTALCDFRAKVVGAVSKNARSGLMVALEEGEMGVVVWQPKSL